MLNHQYYDRAPASLALECICKRRQVLALDSSANQRAGINENLKRAVANTLYWWLSFAA
jgi:hypothetical protein